ncbi:hypothetical protein [Rhodococcus globerulus]|uniref:hypothetical protein n=1 Tax=Rhodococcus globerulus TaxID=33008 RepID=UPI001F2836F7|nr:hypothetical protein [Rhodococcus globerulus]MCE4267521.1 hypothetical protein [Rhodococcus globerulus]
MTAAEGIARDSLIGSDLDFDVISEFVLNDHVGCEEFSRYRFLTRERQYRGGFGYLHRLNERADVLLWAPTRVGPELRSVDQPLASASYDRSCHATASV